MTPNNSYSCRCSKLSHLVPPFIISEKGCKKKVICSEIVLEFKVRCNCVRAVFCIVSRQPFPKPCRCFDADSLWILFRDTHIRARTYAHAHTHLLYPLAFAQRSSCHSNTKLSESPPKHRHGVFYLKNKKQKKNQGVDKMGWGLG